MGGARSVPASPIGDRMLPARHLALLAVALVATTLNGCGGDCSEEAQKKRGETFQAEVKECGTEKTCFCEKATALDQWAQDNGCNDTIKEGTKAAKDLFCAAKEQDVPPVPSMLAS